MTERTFEIVPIPARDAEELRRRGGQVFVADAVPGYPCRQCLRDAELGEELILVSHVPFGSDSPYRSASPIFLHRAPCAAPDASGDGDGIPRQLSRRQLSVRSFDSDEMMIDAAVIDGADLASTIRRFFETDAADRLQIHNADRGCWAASVVRAGSSGR